MSATVASPRLAWAVETLGVEPGHHVLEIGCGQGVCVSLVADRLAEGGAGRGRGDGGGHVLGIDRSVAMIEAATRRNAGHVATGLVSLQAVPLHHADLGDARFDRVLAVRFPAVLRGDPTRELAVVREHLAPDGRLHVAEQPLDPQQARPLADHLAGVVAAHGFAVADVLVEDLPDGRSCCVVATVG